MMELDYSKIYEEYKEGMFIEELEKKYNRSSEEILKGMKEYCEKNNKKFRTNRAKLNLPMQEVYNMYCYNDMTSNDLANMFNCTPEAILSKLRKFAKEEGLPLNVRGNHKRKKILPVKEIYEEYINGVSSKKLGEKYGCMHKTILKRVREYAAEHNLELKIHESGAQLLKLPEEEIYKKYISGRTLEEIAKDYNCSGSCVKARLVEYCKEQGIELKMRKSSKRFLDLPIEKIYEEYQSGISGVILGKKYKCSNNTIMLRLHKYCKENNLKLDIITVEVQLPEEEIYNLYASGTPTAVLAEKYYCSPPTILNKVKKYCKENNLELPPFPAKQKRGKNNIEIAKQITGEEIYNLYLDGYTMDYIARSTSNTKKTITEELYAYLEKTGKNLKMRNGKKRYEISPESLYLQYKSGKTMNEIAELNHCSQTVVSSRISEYCKANGISLVKSSIGADTEENKKVYELSRNGMKQIEIAREMGYTKNKVAQILKIQYKKAFLYQLKEILQEKNKEEIKVKKY